MPDEEGSTAVVEPEPTTPIHTATEHSDTGQTPPITPDEAVPASEQEQPTEEVDDSGAPKAEDEVSLEDVRQAQLDDIEALAKDDPEFAAELAKRHGEKPEDVGDEKLKWEREKGQETRQQSWNTAFSTYQQYAPAQTKQQLAGVFTKLDSLVQQAAKDLQDGKIESPDGLRIDPNAWAEQLAPLIEQGQNAAWNMRGADMDKANVGAMETHVAYTYLTAEERTQFHSLIASGKQNEAISLWGDAAIRAAPEEAVKTAQKNADEKAGLLDKYAALKQGLGKNGKPSGGGAAGPKAPTSLEEIDEALRTGPTADIDNLLKRRAALTG